MKYLNLSKVMIEDLQPNLKDQSNSNLNSCIDFIVSFIKTGPKYMFVIQIEY